MGREGEVVSTDATYKIDSLQEAHRGRHTLRLSDRATPPNVVNSESLMLAPVDPRKTLPEEAQLVVSSKAIKAGDNVTIHVVFPKDPHLDPSSIVGKLEDYYRLQWNCPLTSKVNCAAVTGRTLALNAISLLETGRYNLTLTLNSDTTQSLAAVPVELLVGENAPAIQPTATPTPTPTSSPTLVTAVLSASTSSWTCPAGVTKLESAVGFGSNGGTQYWAPTGNIPFTRVNGVVDMGDPFGATLDASDLYNDQMASISSLNAGAPGERTANFVYKYYNYIGGDPSSCTGGIWKRSVYTNGPYTIRGTAVINTLGHRTSGPITSAYDPNYLVTSGLEYLADGPAGTPATGFGATFPGGGTNGGQAPTTTFTNISVTPGTYPLSIPTGGQITIKYYKSTF